MPIHCELQQFNSKSKESEMKAFQRINAQNTAGLNESNEIVLMSVFQKLNSKKENKLHLIILTNKYVLYYHNHTKTRIKRLIKIDFSCKFEILKNPLGHNIGVKFEKDNCIPYDLTFFEGDSVDKWDQQLQKRMNKRGFHEDFKPIKKIGKGNFAAVYLAIRNSDQAKVAVKAFSKEQVFAQEKGRDSLINEIKLLRQFQHPNLLQLYAVYESNNSLYLVLELLQGLPLFNVIEKHKFNMSEIRDIMRGLLSGVAELARKNVIHRDVKPENIIFRGNKINNQIVLLDFGLGTFAHQKEYIYTRCGTPGFVAPEIVNIKDLTTKSHPIADVFSLGVIFHIMLMGKSPFKGKTFNQVLAENRACNFNLYGQQYNELPKDAIFLLRAMLEKNPQMRMDAETCLQQHFFATTEMQIEPMFVVKNPEQTQSKLNSCQSPTLEDSIGKFVMKKPQSKNTKQVNSIQLEKAEKPEFLTPKKSKFVNYRKTPTTQEH